MTKHTPSPAFDPESGPNDDFKQINGIKQGIEARLHKGGVQSYAQLAALSPDDILAVLGHVVGVTRQHIIDQDWTGQAAELAHRSELSHHPEQASAPRRARGPRLAPAPDHQPDPQKADALEVRERQDFAPPQDFRRERQDFSRERQDYRRQHYATFTVELLLGEENDVRRTHIVHIQNGSEETWAGWNDQRLTRFISESAQVQLGVPAADRPPEGEALAAQTQPPAADSMPAAGSAASSTGTAAAAPAPVLAVSGTPRVDHLTIRTGPGEAHRVLADSLPFEIELALDLSEVALSGPQETPGADADTPALTYRAIVSSKELGRRGRQILGECSGACRPGETVLARVGCPGLPCGTYRLGVDLAVSLPGGPHAAPDLTAIAEGGLFKVYAV